MTPAEMRAFRTHWKLSQSQAAKVLDVKSQTVYTWEAGRRAIPRWVGRMIPLLDMEQLAEEVRHKP